MRRYLAGHLLTMLLVVLLLPHSPLLAAVIVVGGSCTLVDAIHAANTDIAIGGCPAGSGADEIELTGNVTLTNDLNTPNGPSGLPSIASNVTIRSSDASPRTIERGAGAPDFRIFHIGSSGIVSLERLVVSNGNLGGSFGGGGIFNRGQLALTNSTVSGNTATFGGGIFDASITRPLLTLTNSTVSGNSADTGGGIFNTPYSSATLTNSTVSGNSATGALSRGGGIYNVYASATLTNSTVSGNSTTGPLSKGGGIFNYFHGTVILTNSTVLGNSANYGGGIYNYYDSNAILTRSLVANSPNGGNCDGLDPITDGGNNLADDATCSGIPGNLTGLDPTLANNGGPTMTHALLAGSNAIDLAGNCGLATDQRLFMRNDGSCDSGSFEFGAVPSAIFSDGFESGDTSAWSSTQ